MVIGALTLGFLAMVGYAAFRAARHEGRTMGLMAWRVGQGAAVMFTLAVLAYEKPGSFYTNFVILPSALLYLAGLLGTVVVLIFGIIALIQRDDIHHALMAISLSLFAAAAATTLIAWRAS